MCHCAIFVTAVTTVVRYCGSVRVGALDVPHPSAGIRPLQKIGLGIAREICTDLCGPANLRNGIDISLLPIEMRCVHRPCNGSTLVRSRLRRVARNLLLHVYADVSQIPQFKKNTCFFVAAFLFI